MQKNVVVSNNNVVFSDVQEHDTYLLAQFVVCDFNPNLNGVMLNRQTITGWINTLVGQPVVGKIDIVSDNGGADFTSHNANFVTRTDENGNPYQDIKFDTSAIGVFTDVSIQSISGKEYIIANAKIWKRFPDICAVIKKRMENGNISTSWEVLIKKSHNQFIDGQMVEVIDDGEFLGHCLLGKEVPPAYPNSELFKVAAKQDNKDSFNNELSEAFKRDIKSFKNSNIENEKKDGDSLSKKETSSETEVNKNEIKDTEDKTNTSDKKEAPTPAKVEKSELTDHDVREQLYNAIAEKLGIPYYYISIIANIVTSNTVWVQRLDDENASDLDVIVFTYSVEDDVVTVSEPTNAKLTVSVTEINTTVAELNKTIEEKNSALVNASSKVKELNTQIATLTPYKEAADKAEKERIEAETATKREELKRYAIKSGFIVESEFESNEDIKASISNVSKKDLDNIISERFIASLNKPEEKEKIQTSSKTDIKKESASAKLNLINNETEPVDGKNIMHSIFAD